MDRYEEALERAKTLYGNSVSDNAILEHIFPELAESEDERIRKALICGLSEGLSDHNWQDFGGATIDECIAWLKKQKEQKPEDQCVDVIKMSKLLAADRLASAEMTGRLKERKEILENPEKYSLCHPAEWSEEDKRMLSRCIKSVDCSKQFAESETFKKAKDAEITWLKSLPMNLKKKNEDVAKLCSNEWSEEDEIILNAITNCICECVYRIGTVNKVRYCDWLRSLRPRQKYEWDKTDEEELIQIIENGVTEAICREGFKFHFEEEYAKNLIEYITAFNPKSHWKPSEEQMEALMLAIEGKCPAPTSYLSRRLEELYDGLLQ